MEHLAVVRQPFFNLILNGTKTIESRWSLNRCAPYQKISVGDRIFFKQPGKPATISAHVKDVKFFELSPLLADQIKNDYGKEIAVDKFDNWEDCRKKKYLTLVWLENVRQITPRQFVKKGRAGWVVLKQKEDNYDNRF